MNNPNDEIPELVRGCIANERPAQERLFKLFYADMLKVARRYFRSDGLAQEAMNMAFLKVFQNISTYDSNKGSMIAWIRAILIRTCIDMVRKEARFIQVEDMGEVAESIFVLPEILEKLHAADILNAIHSLPAATQLVFNLYIVEGYSHQEIAGQLQISDSTSRWHLSEARRMLRGVLQPDGEVAETQTAKQKRAK